MFTAMLMLCAAAVFLCGSRVQAQTTEPAPTNDRPLFEVKLSEFGYQSRSGERRNQIALDFSDLNQIVVAWLELDERSPNTKVDPLAPQPAHLHVIVLNASSGAPDGKKEWPTHDNFPLLFAGVGNGKFVTCMDNVLSLFSATFGVIRQIDIGDKGCGRYVWQISPSRRTMIISLKAPLPNVQLLSTDKLDVISQFNEERFITSISDHWITGRCGNPLQLCLRSFDGLWKPYRPTGLEERIHDGGNPTSKFISDEALVVEDGNSLAISTVHGSVLARATVPKKQLFTLPVASAGGEAFAVVVQKLRGLRSEPLDMYPFGSDDRAIVYSTVDGRPTFVVKLKGTSPWSPWSPNSNTLAISPDSKLLAIASEGLLRVYRLPVRKR